MIIYKLTNKINGKIYIGLTTSSLEKRLNQHHYEARHGVDRPLYRAMRKYGEDNFESEIIDQADNLVELKQKEQFWINFFDSYGASGKGYNATKGGDVRTHPPVVYIKVSLITGEILQEYPEAVLCNHQDADKITQVQYNDYVIIKKENVRNLSKEQIKDYAYSLRPKIICQLDKNNKLVKRWINVPSILKEHPDYTKSCIFACLWGKRKTHKNFQWKYYNDWRNDLSNLLES